MAIFVKTQDPQGLVDRIKKAIDAKSIDTWIYDSDGDFTHNVNQWLYRAWIRARSEEGRVVFYVLGHKQKDMTVSEYAVYHGRFVEMLLSHFDTICSNIEVTPLATKYDIVKAQLK